jgi:hypothetical protein
MRSLGVWSKAEHRRKASHQAGRPETGRRTAQPSRPTNTQALKVIVPLDACFDIGANPSAIWFGISDVSVSGMNP